MKIAGYFFLICFMTLQSCKTEELKYGFIRKKKTDSYRQIIDLKNGYLMVMLHSHQNKVDALESSEGMQKQQKFKSFNPKKIKPS